MKNRNRLFVSAVLASMVLMSCGDDDAVVDQPNNGVEVASPVDEANLLLASIEADGGVPYNAADPALTFQDDENVFIPSVLGLDYRVDRAVVPAGPTVRLPLFQGWETLSNGERREGYYIITESSDRAQAEQLGVIYSPRMAAAATSDGVQNATWTEDGRLIFEGSVDFSPKRSLVAGGAPAEEGRVELFSFPPAEVNPGAIADANWSSYVVLPSGVVINAQLMANATGIHDRIPNPAGNSQAQEDDLNNINLDTDGAAVVLQLLDGWHDGRAYYFHIVTDTSDPAPATIELGVFAPKLANLPAFGEFPGGSMLPFSPTANGILPEANNVDGFQGLNTPSASGRQENDPTNTFPIDPSDSRYAPMWDAHITEFTVPAEDRVILKSFDQVNALLADGTLIPFRGNGELPSLQNDFDTSADNDLLIPTGAIINCPVISQPLATAIGRVIGQPENNK